MDSHVRERDCLAPSRRNALCYGAALVAVPPSVAALAIPPRERIAEALKEIETVLAELYPGAHQRPILELPPPAAFASPLFPDGTFMSGRMAMVTVTLDSFHKRYDAGLVGPEECISFAGRVRS